ncbi:bifunctional phosphoglucose/phosphomannose isomerase [Flavobacteriales bacterium]|nr:bifunctional phosphoglucose/phosphomannose isomerase [Flavobacteriales bacterium]
MNDYINDFTNHLTDALLIGNSSNLKKTSKSFLNILICGLGGSGIGGTIVKDLISKDISIPIETSKGYDIPGFVNEKTLVVACSYSGNTEETLSALNKCLEKNAEVVIVCSGGKLQDLALEKNLNHIIIPGGNPPRAMFGYGFTQLFFVLNNYGIINDSFKADFEKSILLINTEQENIKKTAQDISKKLFNTTPIIYVADGFEGVAVRLRQQINENSKMLCWHHVVPEMNHNELLGWRTNVENTSVIYLRNESDYYRNKKRIDINKSVIEKYTSNISEIWSLGGSLIERSLYLINIGDWISWYLSELNDVDAIEIDVIDYLKKSLSDL